MLIVKKFGGSSVANKERIYNVARRCAEEYRKGNQVVVVLSAMGDTTDDLLAMAKDINPEANLREVDMLLTCGEQISVALTAMALDALGIPAISLNAFQVPMLTTRTHGNARLRRIRTERIRNELDKKKIVLVTGFQGINPNMNYTTLGRGGSDTTAVALAAVLHADACEIYTDVEGVYSADPRIVPNAKKMSEVTYDEMLEFASLGAGVLHNRSVIMAKKYDVPLVVRSSLCDAEGTWVKEETKMERMAVRGVAADRNTAKISVLGVKNQPGSAFKIFNCLAREGINVDMILQSVGTGDKQDISFTIARTDLKQSLEVMEKNLGSFQADSYEYEEDVAKVSIVGAGMVSDAGVAARMFEAMYNADINIKMIATSERAV